MYEISIEQPRNEQTKRLHRMSSKREPTTTTARLRPALLLCLALVAVAQTVLMLPTTFSGLDAFVPAASNSSLSFQTMTTTGSNDAALLLEQVQQLKKIVSLQQGRLDKMAAETSSSSLTTTMSGQDIPRCEDLMRYPYSPYANGEFLTRVTTPHKWTPRPDGSQEFALLGTCRLKRYTAQEARQCLRGQHVNFIGDSLTRYQYLSLAHLLQRGTYPPRFPRRNVRCVDTSAVGNRLCSTNEEPSICTETDWIGLARGDNWESLHAAVGGGDEGGPFQGRMECACARSRSMQCPVVNGTKVVCDVENYLYMSAPLDESGNIMNGNRQSDSSSIAVSFFFESGWGNDPRPLKGHNFTGCVQDGTCRLTKSQSQEHLERVSRLDYDYQQDLAAAMKPGGFLHSVVPPVNVTLYNRGLWGALSQERAATLMPLLSDLSGGEAGRCIYKTTTGSVRAPPINAQERAHVKRSTFEAGCSFFDAGHITADFGVIQSSTPMSQLEVESVYADGVHFNPWVYEEINNVMLNMLCNTKL